MSKTRQIVQELMKRGLSQQEIGRQTRIPQPRISRWAASGSDVADDGLALAALLEKVKVGTFKPKKARRVKAQITA